MQPTLRRVSSALLWSQTMYANHNPLVHQLLNVTDKPCLSLYLSAHRTQPERRDDPTRYRVLVRRLSDSLASAYTPEEVQTLMAPFVELAHDEVFWNDRKEGIAIFRSPGMFVTQHLDRPVPDLAIVADTFHMKPLLRILQTLERYHVLTLTRERAQLFVGDRDGLSEVDLGPDVPMTIEQALGHELTERHFSRSNSGGTPRSVGHSTTSDEIEIDTERFFRVIDKVVSDHASKPTGLPVVVVGLKEHLGEFYRVRHNPNVLLEGVAVHPDGISHKELVKRAWAVVSPYVTKESTRFVDMYHEAASKELGIDHVVPMSHAAIEGRVAALLVEATRQVPGKIDQATGEIIFDDLDQPDINDVLDDLAMIVLRKGGKVLVLPTEHMPTATGAAAVLRY
ncbi:MAG TPA: hypothetical protein VK147_12410 [Candidatus Didemnitutus sp.]|nr:hypothetical protein [Candidatus Didemnitutus sp.]